MILSANEKSVKSVKDIFDAIGLEAGKIIQFKILRRTFNPNYNTSSSKWGLNFGGAGSGSSGVSPDTGSRDSSSSSSNGYQILTINVKSAPETDTTAGGY